jgi:hypothetical protein
LCNIARCIFSPMLCRAVPKPNVRNLFLVVRKPLAQAAEGAEQVQ